MQVNGEKASPVKKGKLLTKKAAVKEACGELQGEITLMTKEEASVANVLETLSKSMKVDDMGKFSIKKITEDYQAMIDAGGAAGGSHATIATRAASRKTAAELGDIKADEALKSVKEKSGMFNWALFKPSKKGSLDFFNAGSVSLPEMSNWLKDDEVVVGLVRMGFGTGKLRRVKWVCVHWSGEKVPAVKRGLAVAATKQAQKLLEPYSCVINATSKDECDLAHVVDKVRRSAVVDGDDADDDKNPYSVENFMKALMAEADATADYFGEDLKAGGGAAGKIKCGDAIRSVKGKGGYNWVLFEFP